MSIFNSLGSNYTPLSALRIFFSRAGNSKRELIQYLEERYGGKAILTYKGREALMCACALLPKKNGVIAMNGYTCFVVYKAIVDSGYRLHYLDISKRSLNFSAETLRDALQKEPAISAVIVQNTLGIPCDIADIAALCRERGITLIEDLAHSIGTRYAGGEEAGTIGDLVVLSFSQDKVIDAVSGGALIIRSDALKTATLPARMSVALSEQLKDRLYPLLTALIRTTYSENVGKPLHGTLRSLDLLSRPISDRERGMRELPDWYCANVLRTFRELGAIAEHRRSIARIYAERIEGGALLREACEQIDNSSCIRFPISVGMRERLIGHLRRRGVYVSDIWYDAPVAPRRYLSRTNYAGECPHAERMSKQMLNLPTHINVSEEDAKKIAETLNERLARGSGEYDIAHVNDEMQWENFLRELSPHSFLHSWKWGKHAELSGSKIFRLGVYRGRALVGIAHITKVEARRSSFLLCPHGPLFLKGENEEEMLDELTKYCALLAKKESCDFIRFCPLAARTAEHAALYRRLGFRGAPIHMHPEISWILDITKSEEELLSGMRKTTRYLIKRMEKIGVEVEQSSDPADIEKFWPVYEATVERQQFTPFSKAYLRTEFELFAADDQAIFFFGKYKGKIIAAAIIIFYNGQAFYHHSGSTTLTTSGSTEQTNGTSASYVLQWRVIQEAKRRGCTLYNFWGIAPENRPGHAWAGLSRFKRGFGGFAEEYLHAQDKPLTTKYAINYIVETARRIRRRL